MHKSAEETLSHRPSGLSRRGAMGASLATIAAAMPERRATGRADAR